MHKADESDASVDFLDADGLAGERLAEYDFLAVETRAAAAGDHNGAVVEWIVRFGNAAIGSAGSGVDLGRGTSSQKLRWFLAPGCDDGRFHRLGELIGIAKRPAGAVAQAF